MLNAYIIGFALTFALVNYVNWEIDTFFRERFIFVKYLAGSIVVSVFWPILVPSAVFYAIWKVVQDECKERRKRRVRG